MSDGPDGDADSSDAVPAQLIEDVTRLRTRSAALAAELAALRAKAAKLESAITEHRAAPPDRLSGP